MKKEFNGCPGCIDEITVSGLTAESASKVRAPRIKECFLNLECVLEWEHDLGKEGTYSTQSRER